MSEKTKIAWCDSTVNFWEGCTKVSPGCANCYAEARDRRFTGGKLWGKGAPRRKSKSAVKDAFAFNRKPWTCNACGESWSVGSVGTCTCCNQLSSFHRRRIFSLSLGDWLDDEVPIEWLAEMLDTIRQCDQVTWILCSKRWENWRERLEAVRDRECDQCGNGWKPDESFLTWLNSWIEDGEFSSNIIGICSVENQGMADKRIPQFLTVPLACRGLSMEPSLEHVDLTPHEPFCSRGGSDMVGIDWLIIGGESGKGARPCNVNWIRSLVQQGKAAGVPVFVKQLGSNPFLVASDGGQIVINENIRFDHHKGGDPDEWTADLRVQEWPKGF